MYIDEEQGDSQWGGEGMEGLNKKDKGLMGMDNSVVITGGRGNKGTKWYGK